MPINIVPTQKHSLDMHHDAEKEVGKQMMKKKKPIESMDSMREYLDTLDNMIEGGGRDMDCAHCDGTGEHDGVECEVCGGTGEAQLDTDDIGEEDVGDASVEEADNTDRSSVTLDMVAPALKKLHMEYKEKANEYHTAYAEMEADGMSDEEIMNADDDIVGYVNIDDIEDKIKAIEEVFKEGNFGEVNGNNIIAMASSGDTAMRELFMQELKYAIKDNHPEVYSKLFMYGIGESKNESVEEASVEEAVVEIPVQELQDILQLAGYKNYAEKIEEYANEPEEEYSDTEDQLIGLSGGLNGPKQMYPASAGGDNPMHQEPRKVEENSIKSVENKLYKSYMDFLKEAEINK